MNTLARWLVPVVALSLPAAAFAQSNDAQYCKALSAKYDRFFNASPHKGMPGQSIDAQVAEQKCKAGDTAAGIPPLEKALKDAKLDLPPRT